MLSGLLSVKIDLRGVSRRPDDKINPVFLPGLRDSQNSPIAADHLIDALIKIVIRGHFTGVREPYLLPGATASLPLPGRRTVRHAGHRAPAFFPRSLTQKGI